MVRIISFFTILFYVCLSPVFSQMPGHVTENIQAYQQKAKKALETDQYRNAAENLNEIARIYWEYKTYDSAIRYYESSLELNLQLKNDHGIGGICTNLGMIYSDIGNHRKAANYFSRSLEIKEKDINSSTAISRINLSVALNHLGEFSRSVSQLESALEEAKERGDTDLIQSCYGMLAETYEKAGDTGKMLHYFEMYRSFHELVQEDKLREANETAREERLKSENLALEKERRELELALQEERIKNHYAQLQSSQREAEEYRNLFEAADSSYGAVLMKANRKDLLIMNLQREEKIRDMEIQRNQWQKGFLMLGMLVLITFMVVVIRGYRKKRQTAERLKEALDQAEAATLAKSQFLSVMSHEIRTPLNGVIGFTKLLKVEEPAVHQVEYLDMLEFSANHLLSLINDILDFNKLESGKFELENAPFQVDDLLGKLYQTFAFYEKEKGLKLKLDIPEGRKLNILGDQLRLNQVITNLLGNAVKFTKEGEVSFGYKIVDENEESIVLKFAVTDTGIGIEKESQARIFESFSQAESGTSRKYGGTGLGLAICKKIVEAWGGNIWVESEPGEGSSFQFVITCRKAPNVDHQEQQATEDHESFEGMKVLLAEDNKLNSKIARRFFEKWGMEVTAVENGQEAVIAVQSYDFDLIMMDLQMPVMDGFRASEEISGLKPHIPIMALSADTGEDIVARIQACGMIDFVSKPFEPKQLRKKIGNIYAQTLKNQRVEANHI